MPKDTSPTIQEFRVRAVRVPMTEPHQTASGVITESPLVLTDVITDTVAYATQRRAILLTALPATATTVAKAKSAVGATSSRNAAVYWPPIRKPDPLRDGQIGTFSPVGAIAGVIARTDATRGVWKAPAGLDARIDGVAELAVPLGVDCWRQWYLPWDATPGRHVITARATDGSGAVQTDEETPVAPDGASGYPVVEVDVED